ncbi:hypothetical protein OAO18_07980 [Francisellaceae bacterium]|nr:hypothetical protein [Francisellaceae bacterium]
MKVQTRKHIIAFWVIHCVSVTLLLSLLFLNFVSTKNLEHTRYVYKNPDLILLGKMNIITDPSDVRTLENFKPIVSI